MGLSAVYALKKDQKGARSNVRVRSLRIQTNDNAMSTHSSFQPSLDTDSLRPALLLAGTQVMVALLGAVLLTNGVLG